MPDILGQNSHKFQPNDRIEILDLYYYTSALIIKFITKSLNTFSKTNFLSHEKYDKDKNEEFTLILIIMQCTAYMLTHYTAHIHFGNQFQPFSQWEIRYQYISEFALRP